jgi:hypothetical protein
MSIQLRGDIHAAIAYGRTKIGRWAYDHEANGNTRFGQTDKEADCSGFVSRCLWVGGMPQGNGGFGESSNTMAAWARAHPEFQLPLAAQATVFGAVIVYGGVGGAGDAGHVVFGLGDGTVLGSSSSTNGVAIKPLSWFQHADGGVSDVLLAPVNYAASFEEDDMYSDEDRKRDQRTADMVNWLMSIHVDGGYDNRSKVVPRLQQVQLDVTAIKRKTNA